jgi:protein SCO1
MRRIVLALAAAALAGVVAGRAEAAATLANFAFQPHPGAALPLTVPLRDEAGRSVTLARYFTGKPVLLVLEYLRCRTLCGVTLRNIVAALEMLPAAAARDYQMVAVSIDPRDQPSDAASARRKYLAPYGAAASGRMHFLVGAAAPTRRLAAVVGFPYRYDPQLDQYIHPAGFVLVTPDGHISHYIFSVAPTAAELQSGLAAAALGKAQSQRASLLTRILLFCHSAGQPIGRYSLPIEGAFALADIAAVLALVGLFAMIKRRRSGPGQG